MRNKKGLKIAVLVFALAFTVGAAFAATNGMLAFGGTVRINSAAVNPNPVMRLEFVSTSASVPHVASQPYMTATSEIVVDESGKQALSFNLDITDGSVIPTGPLARTLLRVDFTVANTGDVPVNLVNFERTTPVGPNVFYEFTLLVPTDTGHRRQVFPTASGGRMPINVVLMPDETISGYIRSFCGHIENYLNRSGISLTEPNIYANFHRYVMNYEVAGN